MLSGLRRRWQRFGTPVALALDRVVAAFARSLPKGARVIDVGAGPARYRPLFSHCEYKTQDFAGHEGTTEGPLAEGDLWQYGDLDYVCDATAIPVPDAVFDAVLCTEVIEHVPDPAAVIKEIARIMTPSGRLLLSAPLASGLHQEPHHFYGGFTPYWFTMVLGQAGFRDIVVTPNGGFFMHFAQESHRFAIFLSPTRFPFVAALLVAPLWLVTWPWHRIVIPLACRWLDGFDTLRGFTVGYYVTAVRR